MKKKAIKSIVNFPGCNVEASLRKIDRERICEAELRVQKFSKEGGKKIKDLKKHVEDAKMLGQNDCRP